MKAAFTPGPWEAKWMVGSGHYGVFQIRPFADRRRAFLIKQDETVGTREEGEANARLIKAAPELYGALSKLLAAYEQACADGVVALNADTACAEYAANEVLAKARGEA